MSGTKSNGNMRYFQVRILHKQARHLPGNIINDYFSNLEMLIATGIVDSIPSCVVKVTHDGVDMPEVKDKLKDSLIIDKILQEGADFAYLKVRTPGPIQQIIASEEEAWVVPPTYLSRDNGLFMTIQGTPKGLKTIKDKLELLIPEKMEMRISKMIAGDWMAAPQLPERRNAVIRTAVEDGYYNTPRQCTQKDIAEKMGIKQGTVAEHLQYAESIIINSWAEQVSRS